MLAQNGREKILIVDDEERMRNMLLGYLGDAASDCEVAPDAFDALDKIRNRHFSLVISDVLMPGMSGMELLRQVKKEKPETAFIMITGMKDINTAVDSLRIGASDFITKPFEWGSVKRAVDRALEGRRLQIASRCHQEKLEREVKDRTFALNQTLHDVRESYSITLETLVAALDAREHETSAHSHRVREYSITLARNIGLSRGDLIHLGRGALLHDVGKIGVQDSILLKPGKLTDSEWIEMRKHPQIGYDILQNIEFLAPAAEIVLCHQERWDGSGYPNGLVGRSIPLGARIFAVVDTLDAMTSDRPYRKALSLETAINEIYTGSGTQFDPNVVESFFSILPDIWTSIRTSVTQTYRNQHLADLLCTTSTSSR
jgi:response regulator RpfG family c-di-GMP phosphodiesterase